MMKSPSTRRVVVAAVAALALAILAAAGLAATNRVSAAPSNTQPPVVSGTLEVGKELTTTNGTWSGSTPLSFSYQWRRCDKTGGSCANISNATDNTYKLQGTDGGQTLRAVVTAKNSDGSDNATSVPTAVRPTRARRPPRSLNSHRPRGSRSSRSTCYPDQSTSRRTASR